MRIALFSLPVSESSCAVQRKNRGTNLHVTYSVPPLILHLRKRQIACPKLPNGSVAELWLELSLQEGDPFSLMQTDEMYVVRTI